MSFRFYDWFAQPTSQMVKCVVDWECCWYVFELENSLSPHFSPCVLWPSLPLPNALWHFIRQAHGAHTQRECVTPAVGKVIRVLGYMLVGVSEKQFMYIQFYVGLSVVPVVSL